MYVCHPTICRNFPISGRYNGKTIKDRDLPFCTLASHILNARTGKFQVSRPSGSWFSRYPILKVCTISYNSAGKFFNYFENTFFGTLSPLNRGLRPLFKGVGGFAPSSPASQGRRGEFFPPVALASAVMHTNIVFLYLWVAGEVSGIARYEYTRLTLTCDNFG